MGKGRKRRIALLRLTRIPILCDENLLSRDKRQVYYILLILRPHMHAWIRVIMSLSDLSFAKATVLPGNVPSNGSISPDLT